jgi:hypothetical protein
MQAGERKLHLGLDSRGLRHATPRRPLDAYSSSAVLPTPGSPRITSARLSPARTTSSSRSSVVHASRRPSNPRCGISPGIGLTEPIRRLPACQPGRPGPYRREPTRRFRCTPGEAAERVADEPTKLAALAARMSKDLSPLPNAKERA